MALSTRPTHIRYLILGLTTLVAVMLYLDRWCLGFVAPDIRDQLRLSQSEIDLLQSAFFVTYAFGQIPCGRLADRYGPRLMLTLFLLGWSVLTGLMGLATSLGALLLFRLGCGVFESGAYPACAGVIRRWMPYTQRGLGSAMISTGGRIGGAIAFPMTAYLMVAFAGSSGSSEFTARDIIAPVAIAKEFEDPAATAPGSFAAAFTAHIKPTLTRAQVDLLRQEAQQGADDTAPVAPIQDFLNELVRRPDLVAGLDLAPFRAKLPAEVLEPSASGTPLSQTEQLRRNRLLLEVALPNRVCKLYGWGWQPTLALFGTGGVLLAFLYVLVFRNWPHQHPLVNAAEAQLIEGTNATIGGKETPPSTAGLWRGILTNRGLWYSSFVQFGTNFGWVLLGTKLPEYLERVHQVPKLAQGWLVFLPYVLSIPMTLVGGAWTDWMARRWGPWLGRAFPIGSTRFVAAAAFAVCVFLDAPWPIILAMCAMSVFSDMGLPALWAYNLDVGERNVGLVLGWGNMWGNLGAAVSPYVLGRIQEHFGWDAVFLTCAVVFVVIGIAAFGIDATQPIVARDAPATPQG